MTPPTEHSAARVRWLFTQKELACGRYIRTAAASLQVSENELRTLLCIARHGELSLGLLRLRAGVSPAGTGAVVAQLVGAGLAERRPHRRDNRSFVVRLTDEGEAVLEVAFADLIARLDAVFEALSEHDRGVVQSFLARVADASADAAAEALAQVSRPHPLLDAEAASAAAAAR